MIDLQTYHLVLGTIFSLSSVALLIVVWQLAQILIVGIEERASTWYPGPLQGAVILALCRPRVSFAVAYRFQVASSSVPG